MLVASKNATSNALKSTGSSEFVLRMRLADSKIVKYGNTNNIKVCQKWLWFLNYIKEKITEDEEQD